MADEAFDTFKHDMTAANFRAAVLEAITGQDAEDGAQTAAEPEPEPGDLVLNLVPDDPLV